MLILIQGEILVICSAKVQNTILKSQAFLKEFLSFFNFYAFFSQKLRNDVNFFFALSHEL
jgi:hypothetical protein